jgi:hypothetical protein
MVTSVPMFMAQPVSANPYMDRGPIITQTMPDQMTPSARQKRSSAHYTTLEK